LVHSFRRADAPASSPGGGIGFEFALFPYTHVYAGILWFPVERAAEVLRAWRTWTEFVPDEMTSVGRILQFPDAAVLPGGGSGVSRS
jgi:hypothetical protein